MLSSDIRIKPNDLGVVDYYQFVYTEEQAEIYMAEIEDQTVDDFPCKRTYWMSDQLLKWMTLQVNQRAE